MDGKTSCQSRFPPSLNLTRVVLEDIEQADLTGLPEATAAILDGCRDLINKPIDHSTAEKLGIAMVSFLIASILLNIISLVAACVDDPWGKTPTAIMIVDMLFIFTSLILCIAMMNYEGGGFLKGVHGREISDRQMIGTALWMLLAMVIGRVFSNPWLIIKAFLVLLPIALAVGLVYIRTRGLFLILRVVGAQ